MSEEWLLTAGKAVLQLNGSASSAGRSFLVPPYDASTGEVDAGNGTTLLIGEEEDCGPCSRTTHGSGCSPGLVARSD